MYFVKSNVASGLAERNQQEQVKPQEPKEEHKAPENEQQKSPSEFDHEGDDHRLARKQ